MAPNEATIKKSVYMGSSQNHGPLLVKDSIVTAPNIYGYQNGTLIVRITHITHRERHSWPESFIPKL